MALCSRRPRYRRGRRYCRRRRRRQPRCYRPRHRPRPGASHRRRPRRRRAAWVNRWHRSSFAGSSAMLVRVCIVALIGTLSVLALASLSWSRSWLASASCLPTVGRCRRGDRRLGRCVGSDVGVLVAVIFVVVLWPLSWSASAPESLASASSHSGASNASLRMVECATTCTRVQRAYASAPSALKHFEAGQRAIVAHVHELLRHARLPPAVTGLAGSCRRARRVTKKSGLLTAYFKVVELVRAASAE